MSDRADGQPREFPRSHDGAALQESRRAIQEERLPELEGAGMRSNRTQVNAGAYMGEAILKSREALSGNLDA